MTEAFLTCWILWWIFILPYISHMVFNPLLAIKIFQWASWTPGVHWSYLFESTYEFGDFHSKHVFINNGQYIEKTNFAPGCCSKKIVFSNGLIIEIVSSGELRIKTYFSTKLQPTGKCSMINVFICIYY